MHDAVETFARDFGYDLDEEGHPLEEDAPLLPDEGAARESSREEEPQPA